MGARLAGARRLCCFAGLSVWTASLGLAARRFAVQPRVVALRDLGSAQSLSHTRAAVRVRPCVVATGLDWALLRQVWTPSWLLSLAVCAVSLDLAASWQLSSSALLRRGLAGYGVLRQFGRPHGFVWLGRLRSLCGNQLAVVAARSFVRLRLPRSGSVECSRFAGFSRAHRHARVFCLQQLLGGADRASGRPSGVQLRHTVAGGRVSEVPPLSRRAPASVPRRVRAGVFQRQSDGVDSRCLLDAEFAGAKCVLGGGVTQ